MKYRILEIRNTLLACCVVLGLSSCSKEIPEHPDNEFGVTATEFTVEATAGHVDMKILSDQTCTLSFIDHGTEEWATLSTRQIVGDGAFYIDYADNQGFPRMARVLVEARDANRRDTVVVRQNGLLERNITVGNSALVLSGKAAGSADMPFTTNLSAKEITPLVKYTDGGEGWLRNLVVDEKGGIVFNYDANPRQDMLRTATIILTYDDGWGNTQSKSLYITQKTSDDKFGLEMTFDELQKLGEEDRLVALDKSYIIEGWVVSDKESGNAGDNVKRSSTSIDYSVCKTTLYLESTDGRFGFNIRTKSPEDNVFSRYDKVKLNLKGTTLLKHTSPDRYEISGVVALMVVGQEPGTRADLPVKEKYIKDLTDNDVYTFVTLKDCEFGVRMGPLTPVHEGYTNADGVQMMAKYPRLMRDINGQSIYLYTNTTCPYRRTGRRLPYGSGKVSGVVVYEPFSMYVYGDNIDEDQCGNIGNYQLRHQAYEDICFQESESFSELLTEYRYMKNKTKVGDYYRWYPTLGNNGYFSYDFPNPGSIVNSGTWNYLGPVGGPRAIAPFTPNTKGSQNGMGIILEDGTDYMAGAPKVNSDGKGGCGGQMGWKSYYFYRKSTQKYYSWLINFSTKGVQTDHISMQFTVQSGSASHNNSAVYWEAAWSLNGNTSNTAEWTKIGDYQMPGFPIFATFRDWQLPAFKQIDFELPLEILNKENVFIRLTPTSTVANTLEWNGGFINNNLEDEAGNCASAMDYFAIRYNKIPN